MRGALAESGVSNLNAAALDSGHAAVLQCPYGLYAEQLSGTAFTVPRARNQRVWLYRVRPSVVHEKLIEIAPKGPFKGDFADAVVDPNQMRWRPLPLPSSDRRDFVDGEGACVGYTPTKRMRQELPPLFSGLSTMLGAGDPMTKSGMAIHMYACNASSEWDAGMRLCGWVRRGRARALARAVVDTALSNADGDFLIVPQEGALHIQTEMGRLEVAPREIAVIQRGIKFRVDVDGPSRGYICEIFDGHFQLPDLGRACRP